MPGRATERDIIEAEVARWTAPQRREAVARRVAGAGVPSAPVRTISEVGNDPQLMARGVVREVSVAGRGTVKVLGTPIQLGAGGAAAATPPPQLGQDTDDVLRRLLGFGDRQIAELRGAGVI